MNPTTPSDNLDARPASFARLLVGLALLLVAAGFNRLIPFFARPIGPLTWVRWREMIALFILTPLLAATLWELKTRVHLTQRAETIFLMALIVLAISMGIHEPMNALSAARAQLPAEVVATIRFWDDELSHYTFFIGFSACSILLALGQLRRPRAVPETGMAFGVITLASLVVGAVIFRNMAYEPTALDIATGLATLSAIVILWLRRPVGARRAPVVYGLTLAYALGFGAALIVQAGVSF